MTISPDRQVSNMEGKAALPRSNGELVFQAPWEGRAFGLAVVMNHGGHYEWNEFANNLIAEIAAAEKAHTSPVYYEQWLEALEKLAISKGMISKDEVEARTEEFASGQREDHDH